MRPPDVSPESPGKPDFRLQRSAVLKLMRLVNSPGAERELLAHVAILLQEWTGCEAVGVRLRDGEDYPYFETRGFPPGFVLAENHLCARDANGGVLRDSAGSPIIECMCGNIMCGRFNPALPFFTARGSFWTNSTTELLATTTEAERQSRTRNRCNGEGYESVALVPLRHGGDTLGLLQLNDHSRGRFDADLLFFIEDFADELAVVLARRRADAGLDEIEKRRAMLFANMLEGYAFCRMLYENGRPADFIYLDVNAKFEELTGLKNVVGRKVTEVIPGIREKNPELFEIYGRVALMGQPERFETFVPGLEMWFLVSVYSPKPEHFVAVFDVITGRKRAEEERKKLEEQLVQSQKMEAIGKLAGGVAHDFNNVLSVIITNAGFIADALPEGDLRRRDAEEIARAGRRAADLTRQLLAFSRKQVLEPQVLDLNQTVKGMHKMLKRVIGEDIDLVTDPAAGLWTVKADPGQMEQVLMNLAVNARDAMPKGGKLTIETKNVDLDDTYARVHEGAVPGPHVMLAMSDNGCGMDKETMTRIFEPFFTTKGVGKGTGLGLSTVYGIVKQSGGNIFVYSEPGKGTSFKVYLPRHGEGGADHTGPTGVLPIPGGTETILLVEDEDPVRHVAREILTRKGYTVIDTADADEALAVCRERAGKIDLLLTDVVMPRKSGSELAAEIVALCPQVKILFMSGYTDDAVVRHGALDIGAAFIQKPFNPESLPRKVREVLDGKKK